MQESWRLLPPLAVAEEAEGGSLNAYSASLLQAAGCFINQCFIISVSVWERVVFFFVFYLLLVSARVKQEKCSAPEITLVPFN